MKAFGAEIWQFYQEWPPGINWYIDNGEPITNDFDMCVLNPSLEYDLRELGDLCWRGSGAEPQPLPWGESFESAFIQWKKDRTSRTFMVNIPLDKVDRFLEAMANLGIEPVE